MISPSPSPFSPHYTRVTCSQTTQHTNIPQLPLYFSFFLFISTQFNPILTLPTPLLAPNSCPYHRLTADANLSLRLPYLTPPSPSAFLASNICLKFCSLPFIAACQIHFWNTTERDGHTRQPHLARVLNQVQQRNVIRPLCARLEIHWPLRRKASAQSLILSGYLSSEPLLLGVDDR